MLWVDKHRPSRLNQLSYNSVISSRLTSLASDPSSMPHLLFYGPAGSGKKTRIHALLRAIYGQGAERLRLDKRTFTTPTRSTVEINMISSNYHIEMSPGDAGLSDRFVVQDIIKEMAQNKSLTASSTLLTPAQDSSNTNTNTTTQKNKKVEFKVVVLVEVDRLSRQAQAALRRTMEKYASTCRLILCCNNPSKVIEPVRSRCLGLRIPSPSHDDIYTVLKHICKKENVCCSDEVAIEVSRQSNRNLRRAVLMLEASYVQNSIPSLPVQRTDWELYIQQLASDITREQSPQKLISAREKLYELLINCIPADTILKTLAIELCKNLDEELKHEVMEAAAFYEHRIALGSKEIFHLEAFIAKYMAIYKKYLNALFAF